MKFQLSIMINVFILCATTTKLASEHKGVSWNEKRNLWQVEFHTNGKKQKSYFNNEFDAAKKLNTLCETMETSPQNPTISTIPNQQKNKKISQYKGVYWYREKEKWYVLIHPKGHKQKYGGTFNNELDAAKRVNQLCEELGIPPQNLTISAIPDEQYQKKEKTSQYKGVFWHKQSGKWYVLIYLKGKEKYGGTFNDELDAAKRVNQLCEELGISQQISTISAIPNEQYQKKEKTSQYKGVCHKEGGKWVAQLQVKGKQTYGGIFKNELNAAKRVNQLCEELGIPPQNPTISAIPNQQYVKKEKTSQYQGVYWNKENKLWYARFHLKGQPPKYGGIFKNELDAGKRVNQICDELGIPPQNPTIISTMPNQAYQKKEKKSQYKGVTWYKDRKKWFVRLNIKGGKQKFGGTFDDELDAAKRVNQLCEEFGIPLKNPEISAKQNQQNQQKENISQYKGMTWNRKRKKWFVHMYLKGGTRKYGGQFNDELDAAKKVNQLCEELTIPLKNPEISAMSNKQYSHDDYQTIENSVISSERSKTDNTGNVKKTKRKRKKEFHDDDNKLPYFYENLLN